MASNQAPVVDRIRIIPRGQAFLDRNVGSSGEVFYNRDTNSLRLYNGNDRAGFEVSILSATGTLDLTAAKNKIRAHWDTLTDLQTEVDPVVYHGMVAHVHAEGRIYFAHAGAWIGVANQGEAGGGASVDVSETPPVSPESGNIWFNATTGRMYVYINDGDTSQWVQPASPASSAQEVNAFSSIKLSDSMQMDAQGNDVLTFVDGPGIEITNDSTNNTIIISASADLGLTDGTNGQVLTTNGNGVFTFENASGGGGSAYDQSLNTTDAVTFSSVTSPNILTSGAGVTNFTSSTSLTLSAADGVFLNGIVRNTEIVNTLTGATGTVTHSLNLASVWYHTSIAANFTANFTNVPTNDSRVLGVALMLVQGATAYIPNAVAINGASTTIKWEDGTTPTGNVNKTDIITFALLRTGGSWSVVGSLSTYG